MTGDGGAGPSGIAGPADGVVEAVAEVVVQAQPEAGSGWLRQHAIDTAPLQIAPFRRQVLGQGSSFIGSMLTAVAVPVQVYALSHSSLQVGLVGLVGLVPLVVFGLYGGAIADVMDRRTLLLVSSLGTWACTVGLLLQTLAGLGSVPLILALVAVQSGFFAVASSARGAIIPRLVAAELVPAANTLTFTVGNAGQVIGPLIAGVLVTRQHGFGYAYAVDAGLFTLAMYAAIRLPRIPPDGQTPRAGLRSVLDGLLFISGRPVLLMSFVVDVVAMVFAMPRALYPQVAADRWHGQVGPLYAAIAIGSVLAGLSGGWIGRVRRQGVSLTGAIVVWGLCVAVSGPGPPALARGAAAGGGRGGRPDQRGVSPDHPADLRPGPDARPDAGCLRGGGGRRPAAGGPAGRRHRVAEFGHAVLGRRWPAVRRWGAGGGPGGPVVLVLRRPAATGRHRRGRVANVTGMSVTGMSVSGMGASGTGVAGRRFEIAAGGYRAELTEVGAGLAGLWRDGESVTVPTPPDGLPPKSAGAVLLPWPNRIADGRYRFDGTEYQLPLTDPATGNASHGLVRWVRWDLARQDGCSVTLAHDLVPQTGYPFGLRLRVTYSLDAATGLRVDTDVVNSGRSPAPFGAGFHPYLDLGGHPLDTAELLVPAAVVLDTDDRQIPTGRHLVAGTPFDFRASRPLGDLRLDHGFAELTGSAVLLQTEQRAIELSWDAGFGYLQVFTQAVPHARPPGGGGRTDELPGQCLQLRRGPDPVGAGPALDRQLGDPADLSRHRRCTTLGPGGQARCARTALGTVGGRSPPCGYRLTRQ